MCWCQPNASQHVPTCIQWPKHEKTCPQQATSRNIHDQYCEDHWILYTSSGTSRYQEASRNNLVHSNEWQDCVGVMQNNSTALLNPTQVKTRLPPPRASLITSSADHPKKMRAVLHVQKQVASAPKNKQKEATQTPTVMNRVPSW